MNKEHPAPAPTAMANDPVPEAVIDIDKLGESTITLWDEKQKRLGEPRRLDDCPEFQAEMAALRTCVDNKGASLLNIEVIRAAARAFNATEKDKKKHIDPDAIRKNPVNGKHRVPLKGLNVEEIQTFLQLVAKQAKPTPEMQNVSGPSLRRKR